MHRASTQSSSETSCDLDLDSLDSDLDLDLGHGSLSSLLDLQGGDLGSVLTFEVVTSKSPQLNTYNAKHVPDLTMCSSSNPSCHEKI